MERILKELDVHYTDEIDEAAFYGPKLDVKYVPSSARSTHSPPASSTSACSPSST